MWSAILVSTYAGMRLFGQLGCCWIKVQPLLIDGWNMASCVYLKILTIEALFSPILLLSLHVVLMAMVQCHKLRKSLHQIANKLQLKAFNERYGFVSGNLVDMFMRRRNHAIHGYWMSVAIQPLDICIYNLGCARGQYHTKWTDTIRWRYNMI